MSTFLDKISLLFSSGGTPTEVSRTEPLPSSVYFDSSGTQTQVSSSAQLPVISTPSGIQSVEIDGVSASEGALPVILFDNYMVHEGNAFLLKTYRNISSGGFWDLRITVADNTKLPHIHFTHEVESETEMRIYEGVAITTAGDSLTALNKNRNSGTSALTTFDSIENNSEANANADTDITSATLIYEAILGSGKHNGGGNGVDMFELKQNEIYTVRIKANSAGWVTIGFDFLEHE